MAETRLIAMGDCATPTTIAPWTPQWVLAQEAISKVVFRPDNPLPLAPYVAKLLSVLHKTSPEPIDKDVGAMKDLLFLGQSSSIISKKTMSFHLGVSKEKIAPSTELAGSLVCTADYCNVVSLERATGCAVSLDPLQYIESPRCDESPVRYVVSEDVVKSVADVIAQDTLAVYDLGSSERNMRLAETGG